MITAKFAVAAAGAGLLALMSTAPLMAEGAITPHQSSEKRVMANAMREVPLGLLIKTPEIPHGVSFNRQLAVLQSDATLS